MSGQKGQTLKMVLGQVPPGFLVDSQWLKTRGVARSSAHDYDRQQWLERVARGVYRRPYPRADSDADRDWKLPVLSAQWLMRYDFHVGGISALTLKGQDHYLALGRSSNVYLYGDVPAWLPKLRLDARFRIRRRQLFGSDPVGLQHLDFDPDAPDAPNPWDWPFRTSSAERAILEALNELPHQESFHRIDMVFQGLTTLRPGQMTNLLTLCKSVKVKRLFFLFADRNRHRWLAHIDRSAIDLGKGPRALVPDGRYVPEHQLMVPHEFAGPSGEGLLDGP